MLPVPNHLSASSSSTPTVNPKKRTFGHITLESTDDGKIRFKKHHTIVEKSASNPFPKYFEFLDVLEATKRVWAETHYQLLNPLFNTQLKPLTKLTCLDSSQKGHIDALLASCKQPSVAASSEDTKKGIRIFEAYQAIEKEKSLEGGCLLLEAAFPEKQREISERIFKENPSLFDVNHTLFCEFLARAINTFPLDHIISIFKVIPPFSITSNNNALTLAEKLGALALKKESTELCGLLVQKCLNLDLCVNFVISAASNNLKMTTLLLSHKGICTNSSLRMFEKAQECQRWEIVDEVLKLARAYLSEIQMVPHFIQALETPVKEIVSLLLKYQIGLKSTLVQAKAIKLNNAGVIEAIKSQKYIPSLHEYLKSLKKQFDNEEFEIFKALCDLGADPNELDFNGETVFTSFLKNMIKIKSKLHNQRKESVFRNYLKKSSESFLSQLKVNPALKGSVDGAKNALQIAIEIEEMPSLPIVKLCLKPIKKDKTAVLSEALKTTVALTQSHIQTQICEVLFASGANNTQEALHSLAFGERYFPVCQLLMKQGANPFIRKDKPRSHMLELCMAGRYQNLKELLNTELASRTPYELDETGFGYTTYFLAGNLIHVCKGSGLFEANVEEINDYLEELLKNNSHNWEQNFSEFVGSYFLCLANQYRSSTTVPKPEWKRLFDILHVSLPFHNGVMLSYEELNRIYNGVATLIEECAVIQKLEDTKPLLDFMEKAFFHVVERFGFETIYPIQSSRPALPEEISKQMSIIDYEKSIWEMYHEIIKTAWHFPTLSNKDVRAELEKLITFIKDKQSSPNTALQDESYFISLQKLFPNKEISLQRFLYENLIQNDAAIQSFLTQSSHFITVTRFLDYVIHRKKKLGVSPTDDSLRSKFYLELEENIRTVIWFAKNPQKKEVARARSNTGLPSASSSSQSSQPPINRSLSQPKVYDPATAHSLICTIMRGTGYCTANWSEAIDVLNSAAQKEIQIRGLRTSGDMLTKRGLEKLVFMLLESLRENILKSWANIRTNMKIYTDFRDDPHNARIALGDEVHYERAALQAKGKEVGLASKVTEHVLNWNTELEIHFTLFFVQKYSDSLIETIFNAINVSKEIPTMTVQEWMKANLLGNWEHKKFLNMAKNTIAMMSKHLASLKTTFEGIIKANPQKNEALDKELESAILEPIFKEFPYLRDFRESFLRALKDNPYEKIGLEMSKLIQNAVEKQRETEFAPTLYEEDFSQIKRKMIYEMLIKLGSIKWGGTEHLAKLKMAGDEYKRKIVEEERQRAAIAAAAIPLPPLPLPPLPHNPPPILANLLPHAQQFMPNLFQPPDN